MPQPIGIRPTQALPPATDAMTLLVAAVIVHYRDTEQVLLVQRGPATKFAKGQWDLPVGKSAPGKPSTTTAVRELLEETGLAIDVADLRLAHVIHGAWGVEDPDGFLTVVFATHTWAGEPVNAEPTKDAQMCWISTDRVPEQFVPTTGSALRRYLTGGPQVTLDGWSTT